MTQHWQKRTFVYCIGSEDGPVKVGITENLFSRLRTLQNASSKRLEIIWVFTADTKACAIQIERWLHRRWKDRRLMGEWFNIDAEDAYIGLGDVALYDRGGYDEEGNYLIYENGDQFYGDEGTP